MSTKDSFDFTASLTDGCKALDLVVPETQVMEDLRLYYQELKKWSRRVNLIAKGASDEEIVEKHFLDSLTLLKSIESDPAHLLDIGSGAGFPGLVCKIGMPSLQVTLVEPRLKRVSFLNHIVRSLGLQKIVILECRAEDDHLLPTSGGYTHVTSRAVSEIRAFLGMCERFARVGSKIICMKGPKWEKEMALLDAGADALFVLTGAREYYLPKSKSIRNVMVFESSLTKDRK